jgi:8-oxo-dGTP diphosphatase
MAESYVQMVAFKAVIERKGRILMMRESAAHKSNVQVGKYQFPGGHIDPGEPFEDGFRREVREETGLEIIIGEPIYVGEWFPVRLGVPTHIVAMFMMCQAGNEDITLSTEHDDFAWVSRDELSKINTMSPDDKVAETYFQKIGAR